LTHKIAAGLLGVVRCSVVGASLGLAVDMRLYGAIVQTPRFSYPTGAARGSYQGRLSVPSDQLLEAVREAGVDSSGRSWKSVERFAAKSRRMDGTWAWRGIFSR